MKKIFFILILFVSHSMNGRPLADIQTVFVIVLENHNWVDFKDTSRAPYLNGTILPMASHCEQYFNPPGLHPSEPNYLWLESGTNFGIFDNNDPSINHLNSTNHLTAQLNAAGISWKSYQEDISGDIVPLFYVNGYAPRHNPFVFFDDLTGTNDPTNPFGIAHNRPLVELFADLTNNAVARYNFITPNLCNDGHDSCSPQYDPVRQSDDFLAVLLPKMISSEAYSNNGAIFIVWDEGEGGSDGPIGMIALSPLARGGGYFNNLHYTHSSFVRTMQEIFGVSPWLADAENAIALNDLFSTYAVSIAPSGAGTFKIEVSGVMPGRTNWIQASTNLVDWQTISTNVVTENSFSVTNEATGDANANFFRAMELQ